MNNNNNLQQLIEWFEQHMAELEQALIQAPAAAAAAVGAAPRRPRRARRRVDYTGMDNTQEVLHGHNRRGRGRNRVLDAEDMAQWGIGRRRRRAGNAAAAAPAPAPMAAAAPAIAAGAEGGAAAIASALVPIIDLVGEAGENPAENAEEPVTCCIAAVCQNPPVFTWLRCCGNEEACVHCIAEHVRVRGWSCPLCRGDMRA
jgi:hypothetical protein